MHVWGKPSASEPTTCKLCGALYADAADACSPDASERAAAGTAATSRAMTRVSLRAVVVDGTAPVSRSDEVTASAVRAPIFSAIITRLRRRHYAPCVYCGWRATRRPSGVPTCGEHAELVALDPGYGATP